MRVLNIFAILAFFGVFGAAVALGGGAFSFQPPYAFAAGDAFSHFTSLAFVFAFSLFFFGTGALVALAIEAAKFASLYAAGGGASFELVFALPELVAAFAAVNLGVALLADLEGKPPEREALDEGYRQVVIAGALFGVLALAQAFLV